MSLIQEALNKTQNKAVNQPLPPKIDPRQAPRRNSIEGLGALDHEVEKEILRFREKVQKNERAKKNNRVYLFSVLGLLFLAGTFYWAQNRTGNEPVPPAVVSIERHEFAPSLNAGIISKAEKTPVVPRATSSVKGGRFYLSGIVVGGEQPYAVINGQIFRKGEAIEKGVLVQDIQQDHVSLDFRGVDMRLALKR